MLCEQTRILPEMKPQRDTQSRQNHWCDINPSLVYETFENLRLHTSSMQSSRNSTAQRGKRLCRLSRNFGSCRFNLVSVSRMYFVSRSSISSAVTSDTVIVNFFDYRTFVFTLSRRLGSPGKFKAGKILRKHLCMSFLYQPFTMEIASFVYID